MKLFLGSAAVMLLALIASLPVPGVAAMPGGTTPASVADPWVIEAAAFAIRAQEKVMREEAEGSPGTISLIRVLSARQQVVAGMNFYLKLKVEVNHADREADVVIWRQLSGGHELTSWKWR